MRELRNVLHVNVRLSEGGAAGVARTLADGLRKRGVSTSFVYGYGTGGGASALESEYNAVQLTGRVQAATNLATFRLIGAETSIHSLHRWRKLEQAVERADVVHLHAIHSYMSSARKLIDTIVSRKKPAIWTMHDQWHFTGRCAQPGQCRRWETGCAKCPDKSAYPPAIVDRAAANWGPRRDILASLRAGVPTRLVACANWLADEAASAGIGPVDVITNSVDQRFWDATSKRMVRPGSERNLKVLFMCRDLRDSKKVDNAALAAAGRLPGVDLTIVGDHAEADFADATVVPAVSDRAALADLMRNYDVMIFFSRVDYFPLTIAEALTSGIRVLAVDSPAAREFLSTKAVETFSDPVALVRHLGQMIDAGSDVSIDWERTRLMFDPGRMTDDYVKLYEKVLTETASQ